MQTTIYCVAGANRKHEFYMSVEQERYYLFSQDFRRGVQDYYGKGVRLSAAVDYSRSNRDWAVVHTMRKLLKHIRYIEDEYGIEVLERTRRRVQKEQAGSVTESARRLAREAEGMRYLRDARMRKSRFSARKVRRKTKHGNEMV